MRAVIADTGPLYALVDPTDARHQRAVDDLASLTATGITVSVGWPVILEGFTLILYRLGAQNAHRWLEETMRGCGLFNPTREDYFEATRLVVDYPDQRISLVDAVTAVLSAELNSPVWTFDHHFDVMGVPVWR